MVIGRITRVANGKARARRIARKRSSNPAHMLTLGYLNPKRSTSKMAEKAKKRKTVRRATSNARRHVTKPHHASNPHHRPRTRRVIVMKKANRRHKSRNPQFFGTHQTPMKLAEYVAGGLIGVTINRLVMPMLPASVTSNNFFSTIAAFGVALAEWWLGSMISKDFGAAVGFGALMEAGSTALNTFVPQVGSVVGLSGYRRGVGDFVPAMFTIPPQPAGIGPANDPTTGMSGAYGRPYALAA